MSTISINVPKINILNTEPSYMDIARSFIGTYEYEGKTNNNPQIIEFFTATDMLTSTDETPWCAAFVNFILRDSGYDYTGKPNARSFLKWGVEVKPKDIKVGDVGVITYGTWQGHVGFVDKIYANGTIKLLGGNQNNKVSSKTYDLESFHSFRRLPTAGTSTTIKASAIAAGGVVAGLAASNGLVPDVLMNLGALMFDAETWGLIKDAITGLSLAYITLRKLYKLKINKA